MLERLGIRDRYELAVFACLLLLVAVTPLGKESSHPIVFGISRTLLLFIIVSYTAWTDRSRLPRISTAFLGGAIGLIAIMLVSLLQWQGSLFESFYLFYENVLFIAAFIALAHSATGRSSAWKHAILAVCCSDQRCIYRRGSDPRESSPFRTVRESKLSGLVCATRTGDLHRNGFSGIVGSDSSGRLQRWDFSSTSESVKRLLAVQPWRPWLCWVWPAFARPGAGDFPFPASQ